MKLPSIAVLAFAGLAAAGCVTDTQNKENMLAAAGFRVRVADTPEKVAALKRLPPHRFVVKNQDGQTIFFYADPTVCGCLYYGSQANFQAYQQMAFQQRLVNEQEMTAMMNQQAAFDAGPWGPPFYVY